jgi:hypothetical protein
MSLQTAIADGMAASFAARLDPMTMLSQQFMAKQMELLDDEVALSRTRTLDVLSKKIETLKSEGADGRTIEVYQAMLDRLGSGRS